MSRQNGPISRCPKDSHPDFLAACVSSRHFGHLHFVTLVPGTSNSSHSVIPPAFERHYSIPRDHLHFVFHSGCCKLRKSFLALWSRPHRPSPLLLALRCNSSPSSGTALVNRVSNLNRHLITQVSLRLSSDFFEPFLPLHRQNPLHHPKIVGLGSVVPFHAGLQATGLDQHMARPPHHRCFPRTHQLARLAFHRTFDTTSCITVQ
jgi:hypothetical protein